MTEEPDVEEMADEVGGAVTVNLPAAGEGTMLEVQGLGVFENSTTTEVSAEKVETYKAQGNEWPEGDELTIEPEVEPLAEESTPVVEPQEPASAEEPPVTEE
jgi:hypothetical protein